MAHISKNSDAPSLYRCRWSVANEQMMGYHDTEWGVPLHDDRLHFEFLVLDGAQAGLSWNTILQRREGYRRAFDGFDPAVVARYGDDKVAALLQDTGIIRNRQKVASAVHNAALFLEVQREFGSFDAYIWGFVSGKTLRNAWTSDASIPATSAQSDTMSKDMRRRGFKFVGSTICYAYMQAAGLVNDHETACFRYEQV